MKSAPKPTGLRYWMERVLQECDHVAADFSADPVHDLRVAIRRCRSMADGLMAMDPHRDWKLMKKAGRRLFRRLGTLRDVQIMMEWIDKLHPGVSALETQKASVAMDDNERKADSGLDLEITREVEAADPPDEISHDHAHHHAAHALLQILRARETEQKHEARAALEEFDRKQWRQWSKTLPIRAARVRPGSALFKHLALERWTAARELHNRALRNRSQVALHALRIGIKRFRYIVENFLPEEHQAWSNDLKHMQDLLGEIHDLDVLWATAVSSQVFADESSRRAWHERIGKERAKRIQEYREKMVGPDSLWSIWRAGLPQGKQVQDIAGRRIKLWAKVLDPDFAHSERVSRLALELYDGLSAGGLLVLQSSGLDHSSRNGSGRHPRATLKIAALLHDIGKAEGSKGHHKASLDLIRKYGAPLGLNPQVMQQAALVARFHCGSLPARAHKDLRDLLPAQQKAIIQLAAILRLANAFDATHDGHVRKLRVGNVILQPGSKRRRANGFVRKPAKLPPNEALVIAAEGFTTGSRTAQAVAAERYSLETVLHRPIIVKPLRTNS